MKEVQKFTWLPHRLDIDSSGIRIETLADFDTIVELVRENVGPDNFHYPPITELYNRLSSDQKPIPNSIREAPFYTFEATHKIEIDVFENRGYNSDLLELVVNYIGFVYGYRTHLIANPLDRRFYLEPNVDHNIPSSNWLNESLVKLINFWKTLTEENRKTLNNSLFLHNRAPIYEFTWERFLLEYQVFDSLWRIGEDAKMYKYSRHSERIKNVCKTFNMMVDENLIKSIVNLRNDLFHQSLWDKNQLKDDTGRTITQPIYLSKLNQRFLFALLGYAGGYITMPWNAHVVHLFELN